MPWTDSRPAGGAPAFLAIVVALAALASAGCAGDLEPDSTELRVTGQSIYFGTRSPTVTNLSQGEVQAIGFLATDSGEAFCTATLIDRDVAVTARHCVEETFPVDSMRFGLGNPGAPDALIAVHSAPYHPTLDVALLLLVQDAVSRVPSADPLPILREPPQQSWVGTNVEAAGYGQTDDDSDGLYFAALELTQIDTDFLVVNGRGQRGICFGDSGGPLFVHVGAGEPVIAGVESNGESSCVGEDNLTRLDLAAGWIDSEIAAFDPSSPPQTGTQGEDECLPGPEGFAPTGQQQKCFGLEYCAASPTRDTDAGGLGVLLLGALLVWRRRRTV